MRIRINVLIGFFLPLIMFCGELDELRKMNKTYINSNSYSFKISVKSYANANDKQPASVFKGEVKKLGKSYLSHLGGRTSLINKDYCVLVDGPQKTIVYSKTKFNPDANSMNSFIMNDSLFSGGFLYKTTSDDGNKKVITITAKEPQFWQYNKMEMVINTKNFTLVEVIIYPKTADGNEQSFEKIVISYEQVLINTPLSKKEFTESKYVTVKRGTAVGEGEFRGFKVIDETKKQ